METFFSILEKVDLTCECSRELSSEDKIIGGQDVTTNAYDFHTYVTFYKTANSTKKIHCSGSLINDMYVITARRCTPVSYIKINTRVLV